MEARGGEITDEAIARTLEELAVAKKIVETLKKVEDPERRMRVLRAAAMLHGIEL